MAIGHFAFADTKVFLLNATRDRADFAIAETYLYTPDTPLQCPISAFGGLQDQTVTREELAAWQDQTQGSFTLRMLPGDHFFLNKAQPLLLQALSQDLRRTLNQTMSKGR